LPKNSDFLVIDSKHPGKALRVMELLTDDLTIKILSSLRKPQTAEQISLTLGLTNPYIVIRYLNALEDLEIVGSKWVEVEGEGPKKVYFIAKKGVKIEILFSDLLGLPGGVFELSTLARQLLELIERHGKLTASVAAKLLGVDVETIKKVVEYIKTLDKGVNIEEYILVKEEEVKKKPAGFLSRFRRGKRE